MAQTIALEGIISCSVFHFHEDGLIFRSHELRHTYITNLIHSSVDPKTVQYLAGHESSKITMDIYAKVKYNRPDQLVRTMGSAFAQWEAV